MKVSDVHTPMSYALDLFHDLAEILDLLRHGGDPDAVHEVHYIDSSKEEVRKVEDKADNGQESFLRRFITIRPFDRGSYSANMEMRLILLVCFGAKLSGERRSILHIDSDRAYPWSLLEDLKRLRSELAREGHPPRFDLLLWFMEMADAMDRGEFPTGAPDAGFPLDPQPDFFTELGQLALGVEGLRLDLEDMAQPGLSSAMEGTPPTPLLTLGVESLRSTLDAIAPRPLPRLLLFPNLPPFRARWRPKEAPSFTYWALKPVVQAVVRARVEAWTRENPDGYDGRR